MKIALSLALMLVSASAALAEAPSKSITGTDAKKMMTALARLGAKTNTNDKTIQVSVQGLRCERDLHTAATKCELLAQNSIVSK